MNINGFHRYLTFQLNNIAPNHNVYFDHIKKNYDISKDLMKWH